VYGRLLPELLLAVWLVAAALVTTRVYRQLPHILDAISYTFQASLFASGKLALDAPPLAQAFKGPFQVLWHGRLFSQYPPGTAAVYALGQLVGLEWLVGPFACLVLIGATSWVAGVLYGRATGLVVLALGVLSPFVLFQAGSFLSHPIAGGLLAAALAAFVAGERDGHQRWYVLSGVLLGIGFLTREASSVLFALPLGLRLLGQRRWPATTAIVAGGAPFLLVFLLYNQALTGSPFLLPRTLFDAADHFGFGDGIGFHTRHTLAAGLANTDELLTVLQFDLFGWPPLFALALLGVPFLFGRARTWDALAACGFLGFVVAYAGYFYHGIALGPRYYFEAMPWLLLLAGRGAQVLAQLAKSRAAVGVLLGLLSLNTVFFYLPAELQRRTDFSAMIGPRRQVLDFVQTSLFGPRLVGLPDSALVLTSDWWLYNGALAAFNCPKLPDCPVLFALATTPEDQARLRADYPGRTVLLAAEVAGHVRLVPGP
jgi:4-amino-4-deoxy-L-arabinose transferase-like glycosyltransferase